MSLNTYIAIERSLEVGALLAIVVAALSFFAMIFRWRTPQRRGHVIRLLVSLAAVPCLIGIQQALLWLIFLPAFGREQMARVNADRAARLADTSVVHVGERAPEFSLSDADGNPFSMENARGKVVLINFFATWCGPCLLELPHIESTWARYRGNEDFRLLVIGREETLAGVRDFRAANGLSFPIAADPDAKIYQLFAEKYIPRTLIVSPVGVVVYSQMGFNEADLAEMEKVLSEQLANVSTAQ